MRCLSHIYKCPIIQSLSSVTVGALSQMPNFSTGVFQLVCMCIGGEENQAKAYDCIQGKVG